MPDLKENKKIELLAPAGNMEKLKFAIKYGADAVYLGGKDFSLRNFSENFSLKEMEEAVKFANKAGVKVYVTCNIYPRDDELEAIEAYLKELAQIGPQALIISDPGVIKLAKESAPDIPIHLSTQANTSNSAALDFWASQGVVRINTARELSLREIRNLSKKNIMEVECFIHGAMCIAYSGRCLLSSYMIKRDANRGFCAHPCRWEYSLVESKRPGEYMTLSEDLRGSYILSSRDLCMINHIPELIKAEISSFKIEGRMKSVHYLALTLSTYREAIDLYLKDPARYLKKEEWFTRLDSLHHRGYGTGFYFEDKLSQEADFNNTAGKSPKALFIASIIEDGLNGEHLVICKNGFQDGDKVEIISPDRSPSQDCICSIHEADKKIDRARPNTRLKVKLKNTYPAYSILRILPNTCQEHFNADIVPEH